MKNSANYLAKRLLIVALIFISKTLVAAPCATTVNWHNLSDGPGGFSAGVTSDVTDQNIDVIGTNALVNGIHVQAITCDISITVTNGDAVITGSGNRSDGVPTNPARLYLYAATGHSITFSLTNDLLFRGTANGATLLDLLVTVSGGGTVNFFIEGTKHVAFSSIPTSGGTKFFVAMQNGASPTVLFSRFQPLGSLGAVDLAGNVEVQVGPRSIMSYMAVTPIAAGGATETSLIKFDPSNTGSGLMILRLLNGANVDIMGHQLTAIGGLNNPNILISDINLAVPAGGNAHFIIQNANSGAGTPACLTVINQNNILTNYVQDPFCDGQFLVTGTQTGFILGANAELELQNITYLNYIGTTTNAVPQVFTPFNNLQPLIQTAILNGEASGPEDFIKFRNPSAFIVDGFQNANAIPALIKMDGSSAIYFRSGCDNLGSYTEFVSVGGSLVLSFTIDPLERTPGVGNLVFDVEGLLNANGDPLGNNGLNVLSLAVTKSGCPVFVEGTETQFPMRTFALNADGSYQHYNSAGWIINNRMNIGNASIMHTDVNHIVLERDNLGRCDLNSEPTYIGGETFVLCNPVGQQRPTIALYDAFIRFNTSAGFTGVDIRVPNDPINPGGNVSEFLFYANGRAIDNAYGRYVILGTNLGSLSAAGQLIDKDAHLDIFQENAQAVASLHKLLLDVSYNSSCITQGITGNITGQFSVHTIFLGNNSNISIGTDGAVGTSTQGIPFALVTTPSLVIVGDYLSFETHGGSLGLPETSGTTGQGGIFVDANGTITINRLAIANFSTMVVRSRNGVIDLPENQVNFRNRVGITQWNINLTPPNSPILIPAGQFLSDFTMDWGAVTKDYTGTPSFVPYEPVFTPSACFCPPVTAANLQSLPTVQGTVDQFQIKRSRIGDQAHLLCDGGNIRELVFLLGCNTAEAPVAFIVVQNEGVVGLNTVHRNLDSDSAQIVLGINGVQLCANGSGTFEINEDVIINNVCHIMPGPNFGIGSPQTLRFHSQDPKEIRVLNTGVLDLSQFTLPTQNIEFAGNLSLVFEPGARMILGGGTVVFNDNSSLALERVFNVGLEAGLSVSDLDSIRVKLIGNGTIVMNDASSFVVPNDTFFGVETDPTCTNFTNINLILQDRARFEIGNDSLEGGAFQVGNTLVTPGASVNFGLTINGNGSLFQINRQGFFGLGVGIVDKTSTFPNNWVVGCLANVGNVSINIQEGIFRHRQIFSGNFNLASLLAIGPADSYTFNFDPVVSNIQGGANMILMQNCLGVEERIQFSNAFTGKAGEFFDKLMTSQADSFLVPVDQMRPIIAKLMEILMQGETISTDQEFFKTGRALFDAYAPKRSGSFDSPAEPFMNDLRTILRGPSLGVTLNPTVTTFNGVVNSSLTVGMFSSKDILNDATQPPQPTAVTPLALYTYLATREIDSYASPKANCAMTNLNVFTVAYVHNNVINRTPYTRVLGGTSADPRGYEYSVNRGAVHLNVDDATSDINIVTEIRGS
ncbi:MAG TPA: hypothetical protein VHO47_03945 [Candidatus Babeliales bacterium]|nr:hypothetical protein [Candidatus Babeliales bacterium]